MTEMDEKSKCDCNGRLKLLFACSGAADTAEIADRAVRKVHRDGTARMYCLAGVGADIDTILANTRGAGKLVVVDGCETDCARKLMEKAGFARLLHLRVTDLGFVKGSAPATDENIEQVFVNLNALLEES